MTRDQALGQLTTIVESIDATPKDRIAALALLGKFCGWESVRKHEVTGANGGPIQMQPVPTGDQAIEALRAAAKKDPQLAAELKKLAEGE